MLVMQEVLCARFFALRRRCWALGGGVAGAVMRLDMPSGWPRRQFSFNGNFDSIPGFNGNWEISESQDWRGFAHVAIPAFSGKRQPYSFVRALMRNATSRSFKLAIAPGVTSSRLSTLLALQRVEEPDTAIRFFEVTSDELVAGLREGRYDAGMSLQDVSIPSLSSQPLWRESMAIAVPPQFHLPSQAKLTIAELRDYPVYRWPAEICPLLDQRLSSLVPEDQQHIQYVTSFELLALWVAAGHGVGVSAQSRIQRADGWGIAMRLLSDGPYEVVTHLQRLHQPANSVVERFERRALQVAGADTA